MKLPTKKQQKYILAGALVIVMVAGAFHFGRSCSNIEVVEKPDTTVDTSKVDTATATKQAEATAEAEKKIEALEQKHAEAIEEFSDDQREEYEHIKEQGPKAVADWLTDFNRGLGK